ncbi:hypothetical protein [Pontibacter ruber]|uniref:Uncharacterized protein n=1 Tax=Pontibacter ruber TaxID=1343895 RepID=A0ABW5CS79_9BACT|nr:hypothetical protein [Pontibacter ruber]
MEELIKLSKLVTAYLSNNGLITQEKKQNSKEGLFITNLKNGKYLSDTEAAKDLYNSDANDVRYKMLKHRLKRKLYSSLYFIDYNKVKWPDHLQKEQECISLIHHAHILKNEFEYNLVENLANKILAIALQYSFTDLQITALELKALSYSELGLVKKYYKVVDELEEALIKKQYEREALTLFQTFNLKLKKSVKTRREFLPELLKIIDRLEELWSLGKTFSLFQSYYRVYIGYHEQQGNFSKLVDITLDAVKLVEEGVINPNRFNLSFNNYILVYAHLRASNLQNGLKYAEMYLPLYPQSSPNWFAYMENYFLLAVHAKQYELGQLLLQKVFDNTSFSRILTTAKERWKLYQLYFRLVAPNKSFYKDRNNPYLLSLPEYSKDKQGFNVAILILQFIYFLENGDAEALLYRIESLKKYILTHLKDVFSLRSKLFLKLLMLTVTEDFNPKSCEIKGAKILEKLQEAPTPGDAFAEIEIIPYEHLWEIILRILHERENKV